MKKEELIEKLEDIEWEDFEVKEAKSEIPKNSWETVSAFSNTAGGWLIFGVKKEGKKYKITFPFNNRIIKTTDKTTDKKAIILDLLGNNPHLTAVDIGKQLGISEEGVRYHLKKLSEKKLIKRKGSRKTGKWVVVE